MTLQIDPEDIDLVEKVGYEIVEAKREGTNIVVKISTPDSTDGLRVKRMTLDHANLVKYIKDGEVIEEPKALKKVRSSIVSQLKSLEGISSKNMSDYDVIRNEKELISLCEELRK